MPTGELASAIDSTFGNFDALKEAFTKAALTRFGSGWAWLVKQSDGTLAVTSTPNQDSPRMEGIADVTGINGEVLAEHRDRDGLSGSRQVLH